MHWADGPPHRRSRAWALHTLASTGIGESTMPTGRASPLPTLPGTRQQRKRREDHGFEGLLTAPAYRAVFVQLTRSEVRERSSLEAALLELLAAAAWAGIVPADALERVNKRLGHVGKGQMNIFRTG